jgi:hypothetical protein
MKRVLGFTSAIAVFSGCGADSSLVLLLDSGDLDGTTDSGKSHTADSGKPHDASKETGSKETGSEDTDSKETGSEDTGSQKDAHDDRSAAEADASVVPTPPPDFLWYVFDETTGAIAHDSSPNHTDITIAGSITWKEGGVFDGMTTCGTTNVGQQYRNPPLTISGWLTPAGRTDELTTAGALLPYPPNAVSGDVPSLGGYGFGLNVWSTGSALEAEEVSPCTTAGLCAANGTQNAETAEAGDAGFSCTSTTKCDEGFKAGTRYFITVAFDPVLDAGTVEGGATDGGVPMAQVYVNGVLFDQAASRLPPFSTPAPLRLGCHNDDTTYGTTRFYDGTMRDVRVYRRQLAAEEVNQLYKNGPTLHAPSRSDAGSSDATTE